MFWNGFEKRAQDAGETAVLMAGSGGALGALLGMQLGRALAANKSTQVLEELRSTRERKDAKKEFAKIKNLSKNVQLITDTDLTRIIKKEPHLRHVPFYQGLRNALEQGNAIALHPEMVPTIFKSMLPEKVRDKKIIFSADQVHPSALAHEMGHIIDYDEVGESGFFKKFYKKFLRSDLTAEEAAWDKAPGSGHEQRRERALSTYRNAKRYPMIGALGGGLLGSVGGAAAGIAASRK